MAPWPSEMEREGDEGFVSLHPDNPPQRVLTAAQRAVWRDRPEFEGLDPNG
jgi:hypothetical protein